LRDQCAGKENVTLSYVEVRVRAAIDGGELAGELADTGLLGASEADDTFFLYWPSEAWNPAILDAVGLKLRERSIPVDASTLSVKVVPDRDWNSLWSQSVKPVRIGRRFLIRQSWNPVESQAGLIELVIDPRRAFGTGFHATTQLLLEWLEDAIRGNERFLDVGTGSGVLAMAAVRLGAAFALGIDCDSEAIECAAESAAANSFGPELELRLESIEKLETGGFDVVVANLDRNTILRFAGELARTVGPQGRLCLSGIQEEDSADVLPAFAAHRGLAAGHWKREDWLALEIRF
jgi:ribosomal protein L11 methyltransferase